MRTSRSWDAVARHLRARNRVLALDSRGHGDSDWPDTGYTFAQRADDLEAFADAVGMRNAVAVAHSTGGVVATLLSKRRPDIFSRLALLEPMVVVTESFQRMVSKRAETPRRTWDSREDMDKYLKWHRMTGKWPDEVIRDVVDYESYELPDGRLDMKWATASMRWSEREGDYLDLKPALRTLGKPILFIMSDSRADQFRHLVPIAEQTPDFDLLTIPDSGHNMYMDQPAAVAEAVRRFAGCS
jgi:pimeloyl-ACP methyl ester carboxylesterase